MSLRRLLGLSAAASGRFLQRHRSLSAAASASGRFLSTAAASHPPPWAMVERLSMAYPLAEVRLAEPPLPSELILPTDLVNTSDEPDPDGDVEQLLGGNVSSSSGAGGLLLLTYTDNRMACPVIAQQGDTKVRYRTHKRVEGHAPDVTYLICNPLSGQVLRLPNVRGTTKIFREHGMGILTQSGRGHGLPDRFAVAQLYTGNTMVRFLSDTGSWDVALGAPGRRVSPGVQRLVGTVDQETLAFGERLWWVDVGRGATSADPFSDYTETRFVALPKASVLPPTDYHHDEAKKARFSLRKYRRMGVSEGRLRYAEVSQQEPFVLSYFALVDEEGSGWTLEHRVALSRLWADGGHPWLPLQGNKTPTIAVLDPLNANVVHLIVGDHVVGVDMRMEKVIGSYPHTIHGALGFLPCVLPPWLRSSQIPSTGKGTSRNQSFAHVRVHSD
ncbi:uncharacterized protein LOC100846026 [Brachypodium distachyon]|uniref:uncharacterized protein LOC100846026 n=1 Tax=Brachypodium distachyon TaxID=15368 RepID=UPI0005300AB3|nr:uncharacterized protein LOC100846026 [Brachypodium distachyon]|eukprot:XP_003575848.2 uncharacterized protein LOC100846026 [Brachypodium distachyon]